MPIAADPQANSPTTATGSLNASELTRYSRHILLPEVGRAGQESLKAARVLIVGLGGLGSPASLYLAAAGVGTLGLVEFDAVDLTNLQRQILYSDADVGQAKLVAASARLKGLSPHLNIETFTEALSPSNAAEIIRGFDVVLDATDNFPTRYLVNDTCVQLGKPYVYGSISRFDGQATVFDAQVGPCYRCLFPVPPAAEKIPNCAEGGVLGVLPGLIGTIQATEVLKLLLGIGTSLKGRLLIVDGLSMRFSELRLAKDATCPACGISKGAPIVTAGACAVSTPDAREPIRQISVVDLLSLRAGETQHVLLDVRAPGETEICRIAGSRNIPLPQLAARAAELPRDTLIVAHCKSGGRSRKACEVLASLGYRNVANLDGGILRWIADVDSSLAVY